MKLCIEKRSILTSAAASAALTLPLLSPMTADAARMIVWQPTHNMNWNYTGACRLQSDKITVKVHQFFADVEEEAVIQTTGSVQSGDSLTLEILGSFKLAEGSVLRSMLLWNGDKILKAKLQEKSAADSLYEDVVDRDKVTFVPRDPALINRLENGDYEFKIYPVKIGKERRVRILYSVPVSPQSDGVHFTIKPAFASGAQYNPASIPVKVIADSSQTENCTVVYNSIKKPLLYDATYSIPQTQFNEYGYNYGSEPGSIELIANSPKESKASTTVIGEGPTAGWYTGIITSAPQELKTQAERDIVEQYSVQTIIKMGEETYVNDISSLNAPIGLYIKTASEWTGAIQWMLYNPTTGKNLLTYTQKVKTEKTADSTAIPLLWAAKYAETSKNRLGCLYGFVDQRMSLLALERDSLTAGDALKYELKGVPLLKKSEIIVNTANLPKLPSDFALIDGTETAVKDRTSVYNKGISVQVVNGSSLQISMGSMENGEITAVIYNLKGQIVQKLVTRISGGTALVPLSHQTPGAYIMKISAAGMSVQTVKFMIK